MNLGNVILKQKSQATEKKKLFLNLILSHRKDKMIVSSLFGFKF